MKKYAIESAWDSDFTISTIADSKEEAKAKLEELKKVSPLEEFKKMSPFDHLEFRIIEEDVPDDPEKRFEFAKARLISEGCCIDNEIPDVHAIHISWGDWKHEHLRADYMFGLYGFDLASTRVDEEDGSNCYSAWRTYVLRKEK